LPLFINEPNLADTNPFVHTSLNWSRNGLPPGRTSAMPTSIKKRATPRLGAYARHTA
jgi:hypothetical protein